VILYPTALECKPDGYLHYSSIDHDLACSMPRIGSKRSAKWEYSSPPVCTLGVDAASGTTHVSFESAVEISGGYKPLLDVNSSTLILTEMGAY
jgi:hypothetical protein